MQSFTKKEVDLLADTALVVAEVIKAKGALEALLMLDKFIDNNTKTCDDKRLQRQRDINLSLFSKPFIIDGDKIYA